LCGRIWLDAVPKIAQSYAVDLAKEILFHSCSTCLDDFSC
jgi:hypothetical protein